MQDLLNDLMMAGVKWELSDETIGFVSAESEVKVTPRTRVSTVVPPIAPVSPVSVETARACAMRPTIPDVLCRMISEFNHPLRTNVTNVVLPHIAKESNGVLIVTDIPSSDDDASGNILSGSAGELLDKMIGAIGMTRDTVSISPIVFWRTPGGRTPSRLEIDLARPFLDRLIELTEPKIIITLGTLAASEIANVDLMHNHGQMVTLENRIYVFPMYHPNYLILKPGAKADVWAVLQSVQKMLKSL